MNFNPIIIFWAIFSFFHYTNLYADNDFYNSVNNHGSLGLINTPSARFLTESSYVFSFYDGSPDQKLTFTTYPYKWLETAVFYSNVQDRLYGIGIDQDYKDKGFNLKIRLMEETKRLPSIAIGINDIGGTGLYSSEYIVASYGLDKLDMHFGVGWGNLDGTKDFKNPFSYISDDFSNRPATNTDQGGNIDSSRLFSGDSISPFFGISYLLNEKLLLKIERDTTETPGIIPLELTSSEISFGLDYLLNKNINLGLSIERNNHFSLRFSYKKYSNPKSFNRKYKKVEKGQNDSSYKHFRRTLNANSIGVNEIVKNDQSIGVELTQFSYNSLDEIEVILQRAEEDASMKENVIYNYKVANLKAIENYDESFYKNSEQIYKRKVKTGFSSNTEVKLRPFIASREAFLKAAILLENDFEYRFADNFFLTTNLKYSLWDNFDDLNIPPEDTFPAQVRSDVKDYLKNFNDSIIIGRAQFDYYITPQKNNHVMVTAGILEEMFSGVGFEYLHADLGKDFAYGFELFEVFKRDYELGLGLLDYKNTYGHFNFYYKNNSSVPYDLKLSFGKYLAGDKGSTIQISRTFKNGIRFGAFATFTDVSSEQFGEGSFDKGIFFEIPLLGNSFSSFLWRPLTKDPGAKLNRKDSLYDLIQKFDTNNF